MRHYPFEKLVGGLVDMATYAGRKDALALLERVTGWASKTLARDRVPANPKPWELHSGRPGEWYTLPENLYRAYRASGDAKFKEFADVWLYHSWWEKFARTAAPADAHGVHAYSHVNSFSSAAMAYAVSGDPEYLAAIKNGYDYLQDSQCYATGGYGPQERLMPANGNLGLALEYQPNTCEAPCCSWAGLKMARYLTEFTGEARYGDWAERLIYNGIGAALPITDAGRHFYYADYRVGAGVKIYSRNAYTCCSGTYIQNVADYHNQIYYKDATALYVNLFLPSEVTWNRSDGEVKLVQETRYPEADTIALTFEAAAGTAFAVKFRVPGWARDVSVKVNGTAANVACAPGTWAAVSRTWNPGDRIDIRIALPFRYAPVDRQHPKRAAVVRGPVVWVQEGNAHEPIFALPQNEEELNKQLVAANAVNNASTYRFAPPDGTNVQARFYPFYAMGEAYYYRMYFDLDKLPIALWP